MYRPLYIDPTVATIKARLDLRSKFGFDLCLIYIAHAETMPAS